MLLGRDVPFLNGRMNDKLGRWALGSHAGWIDSCRIINGHASGQSQRALVDLIVLLSHNSFNIGDTMLNIAVKGWLLAPPLNMGVANLNLWDIRRQNLVLSRMQSFSTFPHRVVTQGFHAIGGCIPSCLVVVVGNSTRSKVLALLDSLEKLGISLVSRVIRAFNNVIDPWIGEILHGLGGGITAFRFKSLRHVMMRGLTSMHHLVVWSNGWLPNTILESLRTMNCVSKLLRRERTAPQLSHWIIIGHADLAIVLIRLSKN